MPAGPCDGDDAVLQWLPERLEDRARELRKLVEEEDAAVGERAGMSLGPVRSGSG